MPRLIILGNVSIVHLSNRGLRFGEGSFKSGLLNKATPAAFGLVGRLHLPGLLARQKEGERRLTVCGPWPAMAAVPVAEGVRSPHIKVSATFAERVDAGSGHRSRQLAVTLRRRRKKLGEIRRNGVREQREPGIHTLYLRYQ
ncbi:MAG: hypothetical protein ACHQRJ_08315 [Alphaproteobacteria bacterium]